MSQTNMGTLPCIMLVSGEIKQSRKNWSRLALSCPLPTKTVTLLLIKPEVLWPRDCTVCKKFVQRELISLTFAHVIHPCFFRFSSGIWTRFEENSIQGSELVRLENQEP